MADPTSVNDPSYFDQALRVLVGTIVAVGAAMGLARHTKKEHAPQRAALTPDDQEHLMSRFRTMIQDEFRLFESRAGRTKAEEQRELDKRLTRLESRVGRLEGE